MSLELVKNYQQIVRNIRSYNRDLPRNTYLQSLLPKHRAWHYSPKLDAFGPSKFIGCINMTGEEYYTSKEINYNDGGRTERVLKPFFRVVSEGAPDFEYLKGKFLALLYKYNARPNVLLRLNIPLPEYE